MSMILPFSISFFRCVSQRTGSQIVTDPKEKQRQYVQHMAAYTTRVRSQFFIFLCAVVCSSVSIHGHGFCDSHNNFAEIRELLPNFCRSYFLHIFGSISIGFLFWLSQELSSKTKFSGFHLVLNERAI